MFRFTIRDVLWLTVVAALAVGWLVERAEFYKHHRNFVLMERKLLDLGMVVDHDRGEIRTD